MNRIEEMVKEVASSNDRSAIFTALGLAYDLKPEERQRYHIKLHGSAAEKLLYRDEQKSLMAMITDWENQPPHAKLIFMFWMQRIVCFDFCTRTAESA